MNKTYKYTLSSGEKKEITFDVGVQRLAITNANGTDGGSGVTYTAGENIQISDENVISATNTTYTAGDGIAISEQNVISNTARGNTDIIAEEYDSEKSYAVGDYCIYDNKLYRCISAIMPPYWYKIPKRFSSGMNFTNVSADPQDCYVTVTANGHWVMASAYQNQKIRIAQFTFYDFALSSVYGGTESTGYYNGYDYSDPSIIAQYFPNGGYASESVALADLFSRPYFDSSKWTEVTVTDEIKHYRYSYSTDEHVVGTWKGETLYAKMVSGHVNYNSSVLINLPDATDVVGYMGHAYYVNPTTSEKEYQFNIDRLEMQFTPAQHYITFYGRLTYNVDFETVVFYLK